MNSDVSQRAPLSRYRWLEMALESLLTAGRSKLSLDALLKAMPVSKGSFYHHFKNREEFLVALIEYWDQSLTQNVIDAIDSLPPETSPEDRLWHLMCVIYDSRHSRYELLIRSMALEFPTIRDAVAAVDQKRMKTVKSLFRAMGFRGDDLTARSLAFATTSMFDHQVLLDMSDRTFRRQLKMRHAFFTARP